jgi:Fur family transcriptional regulator, ferric uptake regulator
MSDQTQFRMTSQRQVILRELEKVTTHPTADEIYLMVRKVIPHISLGTVYRNLETLSDMGLIRKLEYSGNQRRYDGNPLPHQHIRCIECGAVDDVVPDAVEALGFAREKIPWKVLDYRVVFLGVCNECEERKTCNR